MSLSDRVDALTAEMRRLSTDSAFTDQKAMLDKLRAQMAGNRSASKAASIGNGAAFSTYLPADPYGKPRKAGKALKASFGGSYQPGALVRALWMAGERDVSLQLEGKAALEALGIRYAESPGFGQAGKATLGVTGANGGYVLPNNLVDSVIKPKVAEAFWPRLMQQVNGVAVRGVDVPYRTGAPARAQFADWGVAKQNVSEVYGSYTATLGTLAKIYDVGKQYLRFSAGAAEQDTMDELNKSFALAENYACLAGPGTGTVGVGDPTNGIYTALIAGALTYTTAFSAASLSTIAGSGAGAFAQGIGAMAQRSRMPTAAVTDAVTYWTIIREGTDAAGFWVSPSGGPTGFTRTASGQLEFWGMPIYWDPNFDTNTGTTKNAILIDGESFRFYRGSEFRIDTSDVAGTRWDTNLVGFRGEEEIAFNASSAVSVGAAQLITSIIP